MSDKEAAESMLPAIAALTARLSDLGNESEGLSPNTFAKLATEDQDDPFQSVLKLGMGLFNVAMSLLLQLEDATGTPAARNLQDMARRLSED